MKNNTGNSLLNFYVAALIIGGTYTVDLHSWGIEFDNFDTKGRLITVLVTFVIFHYLHTLAVKETFIADND